MEESYGGGGGKQVAETEDLQEEEVWAMINAREGSNSNSSSNNFAHGFSSSSSFAWRLNAASPRSIPRAAAARESAPPTRAARHQSSAPVDIPDWSKILRKKSKKDLWDDAQNDGGDEYGEGDDVKIDGGGDDDGDGEGEMAPPHEYLARRLERTRIASHSMCEGVGRTLKGRDLRKIRNSILTKTGFIE